MLQRRAGGGEREADILWREVGVLLDVRGKPFALLPQCSFGPRRDLQLHRARQRRLAQSKIAPFPQILLSFKPAWFLGDHDVTAGPVGVERADPGAQGTLGPLTPRRGLATPDREHRLRQAGDPLELRVPDLGCIHPRALARAPQHRFARHLARDDRRRIATVVDGAAPDHAVHLVPCLERVGERLENHCNALAAGQRNRALTPTQVLAGKVHRDERGGLRPVHGQARPGQTERVRNLGGGDSAEEDAGLAPTASRHRDSRVLQRLPGELQKDPLPRVHRRRLAWRDPEETWVEEVGAIERSAGCARKSAGNADHRD